MHYFDTRGVYRLFDLTMTTAGCEICMGLRDDQEFAQRMTYTFGAAGRTVSVLGQISYDGTNWIDDIEVACTRVS